jgi:hypothetical protein
VDKQNLARVFREIEGDDDDDNWAEIVASFSVDEDDPGPPMGVGSVPDGPDLTPPAGASDADQNAVTESPVPVLDVGAADPTSDEDDAALSIEAGDADQSSTSEDPATTPEAGDTEPTSDGDALGSAASMGGIEPSSGVASGPFDGSDADPNAAADDPGAWLSRHLNMIHRLANEHDVAGYLDLRGRDVDPETGKERVALGGEADMESYLFAGFACFGSERPETPNWMVKAALDLTADAKRHLYAPLAIMRSGKIPKQRQDWDIGAVLGLVADMKGAADYHDRLPLKPDYVLACGDGVQAFYLLDKPAAVTTAKPVAEALRWHAQCHPTTANLAQGWWLPGNLRLSPGGDAYQAVQVAKPWDGESRTSLADLCAALGLPEPKAPSVTVKGSVTPNQAAAGR